MFKFSRLHLFFLQVWIWRTTRRGRWWGWSRWWRRWSWPDSCPARAPARKSILKHGIFKNGTVFIVNSSTCHISIGPMVSEHNLWMLEQGWGMDADFGFEWIKVVWSLLSRWRRQAQSNPFLNKRRLSNAKGSVLPLHTERKSGLIHFRDRDINNSTYSRHYKED